MPQLTPHQQAISMLHIESLLIDNMGRTQIVLFEATANCNQCSEELTVNLVERIANVHREKRVGTVWPDLSLLDGKGEPIRFIEVVDSHHRRATSTNTRCTTALR